MIGDGVEMELNDRQREYLLALFREDQKAEKRERGAWHHGQRARPASEWRWIEYGPTDLPRLLSYDPALRRVLRAKKLVDQGAGSTWEALGDRGLIERRYEHNFIGNRPFRVLFVKLTRKGRRIARELVQCER